MAGIQEYLVSSSGQLLDDHLLRDLLAQNLSSDLAQALGAEAAAAAEHLSAALYVWEGDDGPGIRPAVTAVGAPYRTVAR